MPGTERATGRSRAVADNRSVQEREMPDTRPDTRRETPVRVRARDLLRLKPLDRQMGDEQRHNFAPGEQQFR